MNTETSIFNCLLEADVTFDFYSKVGVEYRSKRDIANIMLPKEALNNTILLLTETEFILFTNDVCQKKLEYVSYNEFSNALKKSILSHYSDSIANIFVDSTKHYDINRNLFFINAADVPLKYSGLIMLLSELGEFDRCDNRLYFNDIISLRTNYNNKQISLEALQEQLELKAELGETAELFVMKYEQEKLLHQGINKQPIKVSDVDVAAGYDIASYLSNTETPNKYIEVKNCDNSMSFYLSRNELEKAKEKKEAYYLYLYNRLLKTVIEIRNPYEELFKKDGDWIHQIESIRVTKLR